MDQTGAVIGPLLMALAVARSHNYAPAFLRLGIPAAGALLALLIARAIYPTAGSAAPRQVKQQELPRVFWMYVAAAGVLAFGFLDFPLLSFHFEKQGLVEPAMIPILYAGAMGVIGLTALFFGRLYDRYGVSILFYGTLISLLSLPLGFLGGSASAVASVVCWATGHGAQDACLRSGIAQVVSMNKRGTAFGAFNGVYGVAWFLGSTVMGLLYGISLPLLVAFGVLAQLAAAAMFLRLRRTLAETAA
jgi:MFS family permease